MKSPLMKLSLLIMVLVLTACSNQWREADTGLSSDQVIDLLGEAGSANAQSAAILKTLDTPNASVYFAEAPGNMGTVASVMSLAYFNFLGKNNAYTYRNISYVRIFLIDNPSSSQSASLIIGIKEGGSDTLAYYNFTGVGVFDGSEYVAILKDPSSGREIILESWDVEDEEFKNVIQVRVSDVTAQGRERYIGKFSTLVGYGQ